MEIGNVNVNVEWMTSNAYLVCKAIWYLVQLLRLLLVNLKAGTEQYPEFKSRNELYSHSIHMHSPDPAKGLQGASGEARMLVVWKAIGLPLSSQRYTIIYIYMYTNLYQ